MSNDPAVHDQPQDRPPWTISVDEVLAGQEVEPAQGLSDEQARKRREQHGANRLQTAECRSAWRIFGEQFASLIMLVLAIAAGVSLAFAHWVDAGAIALAMIVNALIGFVTELRAVRSMESLRQMSKATARVRRGGDQRTCEATKLVPGDIVTIEAGDVVPAELRLIEANALACDESALTGESEPVNKQTDIVDDPDTVVAERTNICFKGTAVTKGSGCGVVVAIGMDTQIGNISQMTAEAEGKSDPLQRQLARLALRLIWLIVVVAVIAAAGGLIAGKPLFLMFQTAVVLAVAAIPEGLPIVATLALARGMQRMARRNAVVRRLTAVQTLGSTTTVFCDKTGTLTANQLTLKTIARPDDRIDISGSGMEREGPFTREEHELELDEEPLARRALEIGVLCNNAAIPEDDRANGDPLEIALLVAGAKAGLARKELLERWPEQHEYAFDAEVKLMGTVHQRDDQLYLAAKGGPAATIDRCTGIAEREDPMDQETADCWRTTNEYLAAEGLRVLAVADRTLSEVEDDPYHDLEAVALLGFYDPPRDGVAEAITEARDAGIRVAMITGDQPRTARSIADSVGLGEAEDQQTVHGRDLAEIGEQDRGAQQRLLDARVFARINPAQKLDLVDLFQRHGHVVAMTGDGVNDAPALKKADIGIAMGARGQQVAKDAADIVLKDDALSTITVAIAYGRPILDNIRNFVIYLISGNMGEILLVGIAATAGAPLPLRPLQILYLNLIHDVFPALALGLGESAPGVMRRPPRDPSEAILTRRHWATVALYGALIAATVLGAFALALTHYGMSVDRGVSVAFMSLAFARLWHVFNMDHPTIHGTSPRVARNPWVWGALGLCTALVLLAVWTPPLADVLGLVPLGTTGWTLALVSSLLPLAIGQVARIGVAAFNRHDGGQDADGD
ncbi:MAG: cation-translocating P-type ATPase [Planctomycetota bacterium]